MRWWRWWQRMLFCLPEQAADVAWAFLRFSLLYTVM